MHNYILMLSMAFNFGETHIKVIQRLQNRVVRLITYNDHFPLIPGPLSASNLIFCKSQEKERK